MNANTTSRLDAIVVVYALNIVAGAVLILGYVAIPDKNLPVFASLVTALLGLPIAYGAFRWGSSVTAKRMAGQQEAGE